jgi:hypothetical protein
MGFLHCENIWTRAIIDNFRMNGVNEKKKGLKEKKIWQKKIWPNPKIVIW